MKKIAVVLIVLIAFSGCKRMTADYESRKAGVLKVCPKCNFISNSSPGPYGDRTSNVQYFAVDTSVNPNIIYEVDFKCGGLFYTASDVNHLIRIN